MVAASGFEMVFPLEVIIAANKQGEKNEKDSRGYG